LIIYSPQIEEHPTIYYAKTLILSVYIKHMYMYHVFLYNIINIYFYIILSLYLYLYK